MTEDDAGDASSNYNKIEKFLSQPDVLTVKPEDAADDNIRRNGNRFKCLKAKMDVLVTRSKDRRKRI